jgi:hypothetical protein
MKLGRRGVANIGFDSLDCGFTVWGSLEGQWWCEWCAT